MFLPFMRFSSKFSSLLCYARKLWHLFDAVVQLTSCLDTIWEFFSFMRKMLFSFSITFFWGGGGRNEWSPVLSILGVFPNSIMKLICFAEMGSGIIEEKARFSCRIFVLLWLFIAPEKGCLKEQSFIEWGLLAETWGFYFAFWGLRRKFQIFACPLENTMSSKKFNARCFFFFFE